MCVVVRGGVDVSCSIGVVEVGCTRAEVEGPFFSPEGMTVCG